jgi:hypothetical protein
MMTYEAYFVLVSNVVPLVACALTAWYCTSDVVAARLRSGRPLPSVSSKHRAVPVGAGWSFFLQRTPVSGTPHFTREAHGRLPNGRWHAGTSIGEVYRYYRSRGQSLTGHPSMTDGTLGGWIASGSHGSGGTLWRSCVGSVTLVDQDTDQTLQEVDPKEYFARDRSLDDERRYLITDVELLPTNNVVCRLTVRKAASVADLRPFLHDPSYLRLLQVGARGVMSCVWAPCSSACVERRSSNPVRLWWHADAMSVLQSDRARDRAWFDWPVPANLDATVHLSDANYFTPNPPLVLSTIGLHYTNFELFVVQEDLPAERLWRLCEALQRTFATEVTGRCEVRYGGGTLMLDMACRNSGTFAPIFRAVADVLGTDVAVWLHKGKMQVASVEPLRLRNERANG